MGRINYARVLLGGLLAGVVVNLGEGIVSGVLLMDEYEAVMETHMLEEASWAVPGYVLSAFLLGFVITWVYAAIRPRFGPGWMTAAKAGAIVWVAALVVPVIWMGAMGIGFGAGPTLIALIGGLVEYALAGMAGGWLYKEGDGAVAAEPAAEPAAPTEPATPPPSA